jgi:hypothetical protein
VIKYKKRRRDPRGDEEESPDIITASTPLLPVGAPSNKRSIPFSFQIIRFNPNKITR